MKDFDSLLEAAFDAGVATGAGYPALEAMPPGVAENAYRRWRERWSGLPHEDQEQPTGDAGPTWLDDPVWVRRVRQNPGVVHDLLCLVDLPIPTPSTGEISRWTYDTRQEVAIWALATHLVASDNEGIEVPPMPKVLQRNHHG